MVTEARLKKWKDELKAVKAEVKIRRKLFNQVERAYARIVERQLFLEKQIGRING